MSGCGASIISALHDEWGLCKEVAVRNLEEPDQYGELEHANDLRDWRFGPCDDIANLDNVRKQTASDLV